MPPATTTPTGTVSATGRLRAVACLLLALAMVLVGTTTADAARERTDFEWIAEQVLLDLHNQARADAGRPALAEYRDIRDVARAWADHQAAARDVRHNPDYGRQICCATRLGENVGGRIVGANLTESAVRGAAADLHRAFMESSGHRANIVHPDYRQVGVGMSLVQQGSYWHLYVTVNFRAPDGSEPDSGLPSSRPIEDTCGSNTHSGFSDVPPHSVHAQAIACIERAGITSGRGDGTYDPNGLVSRGQIATFLMRTLEAAGVEVPEGRPCTEGPHSVGMSAMFEWGIFQGGSCEFTSLVSRTQMSMYSVRALQGPLGQSAPSVRWDYFHDDNHLDGARQGANNAIAEWGVVTGTGNDKFSPEDRLRRSQMATFLARLLDAAVEGG